MYKTTIDHPRAKAKERAAAAMVGRVSSYGAKNHGLEPS